MRGYAWNEEVPAEDIGSGVLSNAVDLAGPMQCFSRMRLHGWCCRPLSRTIVPPVQANSFTPTVQSPLRAIISADPYEGQVDVGVRSASNSVNGRLPAARSSSVAVVEPSPRAAGGTVSGKHSDVGPVLADPTSGSSGTHNSAQVHHNVELPPVSSSVPVAGITQYDGVTAIGISSCEDSSGVQGTALDVAAGMCDCSCILMFCVLTDSMQKQRPLRPVRCVGQKRAVGSFD
jgi:hypothetical protein